MLDPNWSSTTQDSTNDVGTFRENYLDATALNEKVADNFLNWVRDSYAGIEGTVDTYSAQYNTEQKRVSAFWVGGQAFNGFTSPGISGFATTAGAYVTNNSISTFLRTLGLGEADPNCTF
jgi:hypothetical protein